MRYLKITTLTAALALLPLYGQGQEPFDAEAAWALFADTCPKIVAAPEGAKAFAVINGWEAEALSTEDGWGLIGTIFMPELESETILNVTITYGADRYPEGSRSHCMLQAFGSDGPPFPGLLAVASENVGDLLGAGYDTHGGPLLSSELANVDMVLYKQPGFPPETTVRIQQFDRVAILNLARLAAAKEN